MRTYSPQVARVFALLLLGFGCGDDKSTVVTPPVPPATDASTSAHQGFLYGRVTTTGGAVYEGRLRWGGSEEVFWSDYFNAYKKENPWAVHVPPEMLTETRPVEIFGFRIAEREREIPLGRPFMTRFGDIDRIEADGRNLRVVLKSGTVFELDRMNADDLADGLRVWTEGGEVVDLGERRIRRVDFLAAVPSNALPVRLHGTVRTQRGDFSGHLQWNRVKCVGTDELQGRTSEGRVDLRFDAVASITRQGAEGATVTLRDGTTVDLTGGPDIGEDNRGTLVDDPRYGRVLIPWETFERVDLSASGSGPGFDDFPPGQAITGRVTTRDGSRFDGRLVYDLDESETTETLDAPAGGVTYTIAFGSLSSIELREGRNARVRLTNGEELELERSGDLDDGNTGVLVFDPGGTPPAMVPWAEIERIDFEAIRPSSSADPRDRARAPHRGPHAPRSAGRGGGRSR